MSKVIGALNSFDRKTEAGIKLGLREWGEETMTIAKEQFVPVDTGVLRDSGRVDSFDRRKGPAIELSFGEGPAGGYAIKVHELPRPHRVGQDKYLEAPAGMRQHLVRDSIEDAVKFKTGL